MNANRPRTLLVTGAGGEIGGSLIERLAPAAEVRVLSRRPRPSSDDVVRWVEGDLRDPASLSRACEGVELVLHMAALTHSRRPADYFTINVEGTANLLRAVRDTGIARFVHVSTRAIGVAGGAYSHSKELAERAVEAADLPWVILRPSEVYGGTGKDPVLQIASSLEQRSFVPILGDGSYRLSPVHIGDVVTALIEALDRPDVVGRKYLLAGPEEMTYLELVERLEQVLELPARRRIHVPIAIAKLAITLASRLGLGGYVPDQIPRLLVAKSCDISAAFRDLDFSPRTLDDGLKEWLHERHT